MPVPPPDTEYDYAPGVGARAEALSGLETGRLDHSTHGMPSSYNGCRRNMRAHPSNPKPQFAVGDRVTVTFPGIFRGKEGLVIEMTEGSGDFVYRYRIRFADGKIERFFEFELELMA